MAVQGASDTNTAQDREAIQKEIMQLTSEIDRVFAHTTFNEHDIFKAKDVIIAEYDTRSYQEVVRPTINENNAGKEGLYVDGPITSYATTEEKLGTDQYGSESYKTITSQIDTTTNTLRNTDTTDVTISKDIQSHVIEHQPEYIMIQSGSMEGNALAVRLYNLSSSDFNLDKVNVLDCASASGPISTLDASIKRVNSIRSYYGAINNRLEHESKVSLNTSENTQNAESKLRDTDYAKEMIKYSKQSILDNSATAMLSHTFQYDENILKLIM